MNHGTRALKVGQCAASALLRQQHICLPGSVRSQAWLLVHPSRRHPVWCRPQLALFVSRPPAPLHSRTFRTALPVLSAKTRDRVRYRCSKCEHEYDMTYGRCPNCSASGSLEKVVLMAAQGPSRSTGGGGAAMQVLEDLKLANFARSEERKGLSDETVNYWVSNDGQRTPQTLQSIGKQRQRAKDRIRLVGPTGREVERVLGGGITKGSLILVGGDPGVGKSTLLLQLAGMVAHPRVDFDQYRMLLREESNAALKREESTDEDAVVGADDTPAEGSSTSDEMGDAQEVEALPEAADVRPVLYVTGEESAMQVHGRARRMGMSRCTNLFVLTTANLKEVLGYIRSMEPQMAIIDSIQTMVLMGLANSPGSSTQMKECTLALNRISKEQGCTIFLVGHVTKDDKIAGPRMLEHIVDTVLYFGGDRQQSHRLLRANKNRFGAVDEVGVFRMDSDGLHAVVNPGGMFLEPCSTAGVSSAVACITDGTRPFLVEIQALYQPLPQTYQGPPPRTSIGVDRDRLQQFQAIMNRHCSANVYSGALHVNVVSGHRLTDLTSDLAVVFAIVSSYRKKPIPARLCLIGEVGLGGELRASVPHLTTRLSEVMKLGFTRVVVPANVGELDRRRFKGLQIIHAATVQEAVDQLLGKQAKTSKDDEP